MAPSAEARPRLPLRPGRGAALAGRDSLHRRLGGRASGTPKGVLSFFKGLFLNKSYIGSFLKAFLKDLF